MIQQAQGDVDARLILEEMSESVLVTTTELDRPGPLIVYVNPAFERMTGWCREDVLGKSPRILQGPQTDQSIFGDMRDRLNRGEPWQGQAANYRKDGSEFVMEWSIVPIRDDHGTPHRYLAVQRDVTERVTMEQDLADARAEERKWFQRLEETNRELNRVNTEQQKTLGLFVKYVPETVVKKGLETQRGALFHGEQLDIVALFCDMRGFTSLSERLAPDVIVRLLNTYYTMMAEVIASHEGVIPARSGVRWPWSSVWRPSTRGCGTRSIEKSLWVLAWISGRWLPATWGLRINCRIPSPAIPSTRPSGSNPWPRPARTPS
jgi:PAS domain S-box-containing protein